MVSFERFSDRIAKLKTLTDLQEMGAAAKPLAPDLVPLLTNSEFAVRNQTGKVLKHIDPAAMAAIK